MKGRAAACGAGGRALIAPPDGQNGKNHRAGEVPGEFVVAGCDASPVLQAGEGPFDDVPPLVGPFVERVDVLPGWVLLYDRRRFTAFQERSESITVVGGVRQQGSSGRKRREQIGGRSNVATLAGCDREGDHTPVVIDDGVNFRGSPAPAPADSLFLRPPVPPALQRCALAVVLSMH